MLFAVPLGGEKFDLYAGQKVQSNLYGSAMYPDRDTLSGSSIFGLLLQIKFAIEE